MQKVGMCLAFLLSFLGILVAVPQPMHIVQGQGGKTDKFEISTFHFHRNQIFALDQRLNQIRKYDIAKQTWLPDAPIKFSKQSKVSDITTDENNLYVLESANSRISILDLMGSPIRTIETKGSPDCQFKNAVRILVNYQGYLFVLDKGRGEILSFSNEGMFLGKAAVSLPISMTLGEDQELRVLHQSDKTYKLSVYDLNLKIQASNTVKTFVAPKDDMIDISVSLYNEIYALFGKKSQICKLNIEGIRIANSQFGSQGSRLTHGSFHTPVMLRSIGTPGRLTLGILDSKHKAIQLFEDKDFIAENILTRPDYTMRQILTETKLSVFIDHIPADSVNYYINMAPAIGIKGKSPGLQLICQSKNGDERWRILLSSLKKQGVLSFDAMAIYQDKLYVTDSKASLVHYFDRIKGSYIGSFGEKGSGDGKLKSPTGIAIDSKGNIYISDSGNMRLSLWSSHRMYMDKISFKTQKLIPQQLRTDNVAIYMMANNKSLHQMPLTDLSRISTIVSLPKMNGFDLLYEGRIGIIDGQAQNLLIYFDGKLEAKYFSTNSKGTFPFFSDIYAIRYSENDTELKICDRKAGSQRSLRFFYSPMEPQGVKLSITTDKFAELSWIRGTGINQWYVYEFTDRDTLFERVSEPKYTIKKSKSGISKYRIASFSDDNKVGPPSAEVEDAFSYAMFLSENQNYAQAIAALKQAANSISGNGINQEIALNYKLEAQYFTKQQEFERALKSYGSAREAVGDRIDLLKDTINIYKMMKAYSDGIRFIREGKFEVEPEMHRQLISLYYFNNSIEQMISESNKFLKQNPDDVSIMKYLVIGHEINENYQDALSIQRSILANEDSFDNHLKLAELQVLALQPEDAIAKLQSMLTKYPAEMHADVYFLFGKALMQKKQYNLAIERYESAVRNNAENADYQFHLGRAYYEGGKWNDAERHFALAWNLNPTSIDYSYEYANTLEKKNKVLDALHVLDKISGEVPADSTMITFHKLYGDLLLRNARYDEAFSEWTLVLKFFPDNPAVVAKHMEAMNSRENYHRNRDALELKEFKFDLLFPSLQEYYSTNSIGFLKLYNTRNHDLQNIRVRVSIPQITSFDFEETIPSILANETKIVPIITPISQAIFSIAKDNELNLDTHLKVEYNYNQENMIKEVRTEQVRVLRVQAMDWDNRRQYACFINPSDINVRNFVNNNILQSYTAMGDSDIPKNIMRTMQIYSFFNVNGITYNNDPITTTIAGKTIDYVQFPFQSIIAKSGDCDDLVSMLASCMSSIGIGTGFLDIPGHVMLVIDSGETSEILLKAGFDTSHFIFRNNRYWLPIEATVLGKENFIKSWMSALKKYQGIVESGTLPDLIDFADAHQQYPPVNFTEPIYGANYTTSSRAQAAFNADLANIREINKMAIQEEFINTISKHPDNLNVKNQYALWCLDNDKLSEAETIWLGMLKKDENLFMALVNLANLYQRQSKADSARAYYQRALQHKKETDNIYRNLCILEYRSKNMDAARAYFNSLQNKEVIRTINPSIYSDLVGVGE